MYLDLALDLLDDLGVPGFLLRNNGGTEKVVDTASFSGGIVPYSGNDNTHNLTITLPDGSTETHTYHVVTTSHGTVVNGTRYEANGGIQT